MAILRVSDLSSILNNGNGRVISIERGVERDVLGDKGPRSQGGTETPQLRYSIFEISWPKENRENPTQFFSKSISYENLSAYITHNILNEDYSFSGNKFLNGQLSVVNEKGSDSLFVCGNSLFDGDVGITGSITVGGGTTLSGETIIGGNLTIRNGNIDASGETAKFDYKSITIGADNINLTCNNTINIYHGDIEIFKVYKDQSGIHISFPSTTKQLPIDCYAKHALWS